MEDFSHGCLHVRTTADDFVGFACDTLGIPSCPCGCCTGFPLELSVDELPLLERDFESRGAEVFDGVFFGGAEILLGCLFIF